MGILVPIGLFFGITVIFGLVLAGSAIKNIEHRRQPD